jgi:prophage regulatory protein
MKLMNQAREYGADVYFSDKDLARRFGVGRATIWRWVRDQGFPEPVKLSPHCTRWRLDDVQAWEGQRGAA